MFFSDGIRTKLTNAHKFPIKEYADAGCIKRLNVPIKNNKKTIEVQKVSQKSEIRSSSTLLFLFQLDLPLRIKQTGGRVTVISTRLLMFNRIAKVHIKIQHFTSLPLQIVGWKPVLD